jgi:hypothetical protein
MVEVPLAPGATETALAARVKVAPEGSAPVPLSVTACGEPPALSATLIEADNAPGAVGAKLTVIVHEEPTVKPVPQLLV